MDEENLPVIEPVSREMADRREINNINNVQVVMAMSKKVWKVRKRGIIATFSHLPDLL